MQILSRCPWSGFCCWSFIYSACSVYSYLFIFWTVTWQSPGPCDTHTHIKKHLSSQYLAVLQEFKLSQKSTSILYYQLFWAKNCSWVLTFRNGAKCLGYVAYKIWERDKSTLGVMGVKRKCQSVRWVGKLKHSVLHVWMSCKQVYVLCTKLLCKQFFLYY